MRYGIGRTWSRSHSFPQLRTMGVKSGFRSRNGCRVRKTAPKAAQSMPSRTRIKRLSPSRVTSCCRRRTAAVTQPRPTGPRSPGPARQVTGGCGQGSGTEIPLRAGYWPSSHRRKRWLRLWRSSSFRPDLAPPRRFKLAIRVQYSHRSIGSGPKPAADGSLPRTAWRWRHQVLQLAPQDLDAVSSSGTDG